MPRAFDPETNSLSEEFLREEFSQIEWDEPQRIEVLGIGRGLGCRICIARFGFKAQDVVRLFSSKEEFDEHKEQFHSQGVE